MIVIKKKIRNPVYQAAWASIMLGMMCFGGMLENFRRHMVLCGIIFAVMTLITTWVGIEEAINYNNYNKKDED